MEDEFSMLSVDSKGTENWYFVKFNSTLCLKFLLNPKSLRDFVSIHAVKLQRNSGNFTSLKNPFCEEHCPEIRRLQHILGQSCVVLSYHHRPHHQYSKLNAFVQPNNMLRTQEGMAKGRRKWVRRRWSGHKVQKANMCLSRPRHTPNHLWLLFCSLRS